MAAPINVIMPAMDKPIDNIIDRAYNDSEMAAEMAEAIQNPKITQWPKTLQKELRISMTDCRLQSRRIWYRD
jgi:hypothetical protein